MTTIIRANSAHEHLAATAMVELHGKPVASDIAISEFLRDPARYLLLALEDDQVAGSLIGYALRHPHRCEPQFLLYEIDVRPNRWNGGIGGALVKRFIAEAQAAGAFEVWTLTNHSNSAAMAMYSRCGFTRPNQDDVMRRLRF